MIPLFKVLMSPNASSSAERVLNSGYVGEGEQVAMFEQMLASTLHNANVVTTNSGTSAIMLALRLAGVGPGDTVISTPMTCLATNEPIIIAGAKILWADIEPYTGNISASSVAELVRKNDVKAIVCVHWGGYPCDLGALNMISLMHNIPIIEDAAHAFMSTYNGNLIGNCSNYTCFSFQAIKQLTTVDGGALLTKSETGKGRAVLMRWFGLDRKCSSDMRCLQDPTEPGFKFHMNNLNAAIGITNLRGAIDAVEAARKNAARYNTAFRELDFIDVLNYDKGRVSSYWLYDILTDYATDFIEYMRRNDVACSKVHGRNDHKSMFSSSKRPLPGVDEFDRRHVCIPVGWWLSDDDVSKIIDLVRRYKPNG